MHHCIAAAELTIKYAKFIQANGYLEHLNWLFIILLWFIIVPYSSFLQKLESIIIDNNTNRRTQRKFTSSM